MSYTFSLETEVQNVDIGFLIDTTCSMGSTRAAMASEFTEIVDQIRDTTTTAQYGYATFDDYNYGSFGHAEHGDTPYKLHQQITYDTARVQAALAATPEHHGGDGPESSMEALYQAAAGRGYDQDCDGVFEEESDVLPFFAWEGDVFSGTAPSAWTPDIPGGGPNGGMGFRDDVLPILIYATDNMMRDPDAGYPVPGGCPRDASMTDVAEAAEAIGARIIGIASEDTPQWSQMEDLSAITSSFYDSDGDDLADEPLVFHWTGSDSTFTSTIVGAVEWLLGGVHFDRVHLEAETEPWGFIQTVTPEAYEDLTIGVSGEELVFTITLDGVVPALPDDAIYPVTLNVYGDDTTLLASEPLLIVVPGIF